MALSSHKYVEPSHQLMDCCLYPNCGKTEYDSIHKIVFLVEDCTVWIFSNSIETATRILHRPSGLVETCDEKIGQTRQHNRAMTRLRERVESLGK